MDGRKSVANGRPVRALSPFLLRGLMLVGGAFGLAYYDGRRLRTETELATQKDALAAVRADAEARLAAFERQASAAVEDARRTALAADDASRRAAESLRAEFELQTERIVAQAKLLGELDCRYEEGLGKTRDDLELRLRRLVERVDADREAAGGSDRRFRAVQKRADSAVFLVHSTFKYDLKEDDAWLERDAAAWGTAFLATKDGILVTNKHLVHPWKFDADLCALVAMGEARVRPESLKLAAWPVGDVCLDKDKRPLFENGFNTDRGDLAFVLAAEDRNIKRSTESYHRSVEYEAHALDDHDLALLWIAGGPFEPLQIATEEEERGLKKLDPVMTLGFPRGNSGLESSIAESSASVGVVRKIENTVQITAPIIAGNSGGPLLDEHGRVVGVATRIFSETLGICIKAGRVRELLAEADRRREAAYSAFLPGAGR